jgi:hypothetical protein
MTLSTLSHISLTVFTGSEPFFDVWNYH